MKKNNYPLIVENTKKLYDNLRCDPKIISSWSPLEPNIIDYHCRQLECFGELLENLQLNSFKVLDFGCGSGRLIRDLIEFGVKTDSIRGLEIDQKLIDQAFNFLPIDIYHKFNGIEIPFSDSTFDMVCQSTVFSSIADDNFRHHLAQELLRVTKKEGYILWWDKLNTTDFAGQESLKLDELFKDQNIKKIETGRKPLPSKNIRKLKGFGTIIGKLADFFLYFRVSHVAALIGPLK